MSYTQWQWILHTKGLIWWFTVVKNTAHWITSDGELMTKLPNQPAPVLWNNLQWYRYTNKCISELGSIVSDNSLSPVWHQAINTLRPRQNGRHFADDTFKRIFVYENVKILIEISLKFVPKGPINNIPALVQIMAWRRPGDKPLSEPMLVCLPTHLYASLGLNELTEPMLTYHQLDP